MDTDAEPFNLADLATGCVTLYLVLPVNRLRSHGRWLRMILTLVISAIASVAEPPDLPVTLLLDELGTISPGSGLSMIEQSYGLMAGLGIRIWAFLQDLPQLQRDYPNSWETFISNSSVIQLLNVADGTTSKYFPNTSARPPSTQKPAAGHSRQSLMPTQTSMKTEWWISPPLRLSD